jgi:hypothetical protein
VPLLGDLNKKDLAEELANRALRFMATPDSDALMIEVIQAIRNLDMYRREALMVGHAYDLLGDEMKVGIYSLQFELRKYNSPMLQQLCARWPERRRIEVYHETLIDDLCSLQPFDSEVDRLFRAEQQQKRQEGGDDDGKKPNDCGCASPRSPYQ